MARPLIVGNWKAYVESLKEARALLKGIEKALPRGSSADVVLCPPAPFLDPLRDAYHGRRLTFGAQDASDQGGKQTGATTPEMLRDIGAVYVIVGHSERRGSGDTDDIISKKLVSILDAGLTPILCIGEQVRDKEGHYFAELERTLLASLHRIEPMSLKKLVIAYEPIWAVGASTTPSAREIQETIIFLRKALATRYERGLAMKVRILYGGDVNSTNTEALLGGSGVSGFLVGRASVEAEEFCAIIKACTT